MSAGVWREADGGECLHRVSAGNGQRLTQSGQSPNNHRAEAKKGLYAFRLLPQDLYQFFSNKGFDRSFTGVRLKRCATR